MDFIQETITQNTLQCALERLNGSFQMEAINNYFKTKNEGLPLIHALCFNPTLNIQEKQNALTLLLETGICINEPDRERKTILDRISAADPLYSFLIARNAKESSPTIQPLKSNLKKSYDSPPASPALEQVPRLKRQTSFTPNA